MPRFLLEDFFATYRPGTTWNLASSDVEALTLQDVLAGADDEVATLWSTASMGYAPNRGLPLLRDAIAGRYSTVSADQVHVTSGATEAVFIAVNVLIEAGDHVVVVGPTYQLLIDSPAAAGADVTRVDLRFDEGWALDLQRVREAVTPRTKLIIVNFPNNPTGTVLSPDELRALADLAEKNGAWLLSDELYRGLEGDMAESATPAAVDLGARAISIGGMSKVYGLAGARIGWVASTDEWFQDQIRTYRYWSSLGSSALSEIVALAALRRHDELIDRARTIIDGNTAILEKIIHAHPDALAWRPQGGGSTAFVQLRHETAARLAARAAADHGILVIPSNVLPFAGEFLRIGLGRQAGAEALHRFEAAL